MLYPLNFDLQLVFYGSYPCMFAIHTKVKPIDIQSIKKVHVDDPDQSETFCRH